MRSLFRSLRRRSGSSAPWSPEKYSAFKEERLRPETDLLARVPALASRPSVLDVGCGDGTPAVALLERFADAKLHCIDSSSDMLSAARKTLAGRSDVSFAEVDFERHFARDSPQAVYDLVFANASLHWLEGDLLDLLKRILGRVRPAGCIAMQIPDTRAQPSHALLAEVARHVDPSGPAAAMRVASNTTAPFEYCDALLGPLAASVDTWSTTYTMVLDGGEDAVFDFVRATAMRPFLAALGGEGSEPARAFEAEYRRRVSRAYPQRSDGTTLFPFTRLFLVATRPSLVDVYSEYMEYHNHQLDKGWKS